MGRRERGSQEQGFYSSPNSQNEKSGWRGWAAPTGNRLREPCTQPLGVLGDRLLLEEPGSKVHEGRETLDLLLHPPVQNNKDQLQEKPGT